MSAGGAGTAITTAMVPEGSTGQDVVPLQRHLDGTPEHPRQLDTSREREEDTRKLFMAAAETRRNRVEDVLRGEINEINEDVLMLAVEMDTIQAQSDHMRLIRAASLAIQYYRVNPAADTKRKFLQKVAATFGVGWEDLQAYALVVGAEMRYREQMGYSPLADLPQLSKMEEGSTALALPPTRSSSRAKHYPSEYVELAEQGLNNTEIANRLGDVSEASVRRGLAAAGYERVT